MQDQNKPQYLQREEGRRPPQCTHWAGSEGTRASGGLPMGPEQECVDPMRPVLNGVVMVRKKHKQFDDAGMRRMCTSSQQHGQRKHALLRMYTHSAALQENTAVQL
jgi:hypothetical protein